MYKINIYPCEMVSIILVVKTFNVNMLNRIFCSIEYTNTCLHNGACSATCAGRAARLATLQYECAGVSLYLISLAITT